MRYLILATDTHEGDTTVYYTSAGWTALRKHADRFTDAKAKEWLAKLQSIAGVPERFRDMAIVAD